MSSSVTWIFLSRRFAASDSTRTPFSSLRREGFGSVLLINRSTAALVEAPFALLNLSTISRDSGESVTVVLRGAEEIVVPMGKSMRRFSVLCKFVRDDAIRASLHHATLTRCISVTLGTASQPSVALPPHRSPCRPIPPPPAVRQSCRSSSSPLRRSPRATRCTGP
jgi:hypothetical protein